MMIKVYRQHRTRIYAAIVSNFSLKPDKIFFLLKFALYELFHQFHRHCPLNLLENEGHNQGWCGIGIGSRVRCGTDHYDFHSNIRQYSSFAYFSCHLTSIVMCCWPVDNSLIRKILSTLRIGTCKYFIMILLYH